MPVEAFIPIIIGVVFMGLIIVLLVVVLKNVKQHISCSVDGHFVEIETGYSFVKLTVDNKVVDEIHSYYMTTAKLQGIIDGKQILVNIGSGFLKPQIITFIDGNKVDGLSNI